MKRLTYVWLVCLLPVAASASAAPRYHLTDLGTLGGTDSVAYGINNSGQVVGQADIDNDGSHAFLYNGAAMTDLGTLGGFASWGSAINDHGQVVGRAYTNAADHAFLYSAGTMTDLGTLGGSRSNAYDINDNGQVVGSAYNGRTAGFFQDPIERAFLYTDGTMTDLGMLPGGNRSVATGVNNRGQIVGYSEQSNNAGGIAQHAFLYADGIMTDLGTLGGNHSWAYGINDSGQVVGYSYASNDEYHAFLYSDGIMTDLATLGGGFSLSIGINNRGEVVGSSLSGPFLYSDGTMYALNTLVDYPEPGWRLFLVEDINDSGWIVGRGIYDPDGRGGVPSVERAILLTPVVAEPSSVVLGLAGAIVLVAHRARTKSQQSTKDRVGRIV